MTEQAYRFQRRTFLKAVGIGAAAAAVGVGGELAWSAMRTSTVTANGKLYRSDGGPRIQVSNDQGRSWRTHTDFGSPLGVHHLTAVAPDTVRATVGYRGRRFDLQLGTDDLLWWTV